MIQREVFGLSRRDWVFAGVAWLVLAVGALALAILMATTEGAPASGRLFGFIAVVMLGPALLIGAASLAVFGIRGRVKNACGLAGLTIVVMVVAMMLMMIHSGMLHAPRYLAYGKLFGTVAEVADKNAASVEITPAFVDIRRIGHGLETSTDSEGRTSATHRYVSPIVSASGERDLAQADGEPIVLFLCDSDEDNLRAAAERSGAVSGRMHPVVSRAERLAIENVPNLVRGPGTPQCVVPGGGWAVVWVLLWILLMLVVSVGGTVLMVAVRMTRP